MAAFFGCRKRILRDQCGGDDVIEEGILGFVGRNGADHPTWLLGRQTFNFAMLGKHLDDMVHHLAALVDVRVFATAKQHRHLDFVIVLQKANSLLDLEPDIVLAGFRTNANFFKPGLM